jgi:membrane-associated phospholipid phosphatase
VKAGACVASALPRPTSERIWCAYFACVLAVAVFAPGGGSDGYAPWLCAAVHAVVLAAVVACGWLATRRSPAAARVPRAGLAIVGLPTVFTALCWLLPAVHPEPYEWWFLAVDRTLVGADPGAFVRCLPGWLVEAMQVSYGAFYGICALSAIAAGLASGPAAFDRAVLLLVGGFLASYLGYLLVPTLGPNRVLAFDHDVLGVWIAAPLRATIDAGEANPWDCFPSGHTMMTLTSLLILWRWNRRWLPWLLTPCLLLLVSTVLLRYHWLVDVAAGALLAWPVARGCDKLADRDGWAPAPPLGGLSRS